MRRQHHRGPRVQGRCSDAPPAEPPLEGYREGQCVVYGNTQTLRFSFESAPAWVDNIHFHGTCDAAAAFNLLQITRANLRTYYTGLTLQGDGGLCTGIDLARGSAHFFGVPPLLRTAP